MHDWISQSTDYHRCERNEKSRRWKIYRYSCVLYINSMQRLQLAMPLMLSVLFVSFEWRSENFSLCWIQRVRSLCFGPIASLFPKRILNAYIFPQCSFFSLLFFGQFTFSSALTLTETCIALTISQRIERKEYNQQQRLLKSQSVNTHFYLLHANAISNNLTSKSMINGAKAIRT